MFSKFECWPMISNFHEETHCKKLLENEVMTSKKFSSVFVHIFNVFKSLYSTRILSIKIYHEIDNFGYVSGGKLFWPHQLLPCFVVILSTETKKRKTHVDNKRRGGPRFFPASAMMFSSIQDKHREVSSVGISRRYREEVKGRVRRTWFAKDF